MIIVKEPFWIPNFPNGPYARGTEVELGAEIEEQLVPEGVASEKAEASE